jgi:uncharacterized membrane protein (DUF485 family)
MLHEPAAQCGPDNASGYKTSLGVKMFIIYALVYSGFVAINLISPKLMESTVVFGLNLAVCYGFGLIVLALVMALVYNKVCTAKEMELNGKEPVTKEGEDK